MNGPQTYNGLIWLIIEEWKLTNRCWQALYKILILQPITWQQNWPISFGEQTWHLWLTIDSFTNDYFRVSLSLNKMARYVVYLLCCVVNREGRVLGVLEVSRSIGDGRFKRCGVSCVPDVMRCTLTDNDRYGIRLASRARFSACLKHVSESRTKINPFWWRHSAEIRIASPIFCCWVWIFAQAQL